MAHRPMCPLCEKRRPERFCPAKGEKICAVCCGTEREITLDCPADCSYLVAAHRYEREHGKPLPESEIPFRDILFSPDLIYARQPVVSGLGYAIARFAAEQRALTDRDALATLTALAETHRTLVSGIYYENPPAAVLPKSLYATLASFLQDYRKQESERAALPVLKESEILYILVFLARMARSRMSERPRARLFLEFLRAQFPVAPELQPETSRIIIP
jgi:hypothetical protein